MLALTREVSPAFAACELSFLQREPIDVDLAIAQHRAYCHALRALGCEMVSLPAQSPEALRTPATGQCQLLCPN